MKNIVTLFLILSSALIVFAQNKHTKASGVNYSQSLANGIIKMDKSYFFYKNVTNNEIISSTVRMKNYSDEDLELVFRSLPNHITIEQNSSVIKANSTAQIKIIYNTKKLKNKDGTPKLGKEYRRIPVYIKGKEKLRDSRRDYITIRTFVTEDFSYLTKKQLKRAPKIEFDTIVYNFGKVEQGLVVVHDFVFKNKGKDDLDIRYAKGC